MQGRYIDIPLVAGADEVIELVGRAITMVDDHQQDADVCQLLQDMADMEDAGYGRCDEALHLQVLDDVKPDGPHKGVAPAEDIRANKRTCDEARHHENAMIAALNKLSQHCSK